MTITITKNRTSYTGSGSAGPFAVADGGDGIYFAADTELVLTRIDTDGEPTTLSYPADYTVLGAGTDSGSVTLAAPLAVGETLDIERQTPLTQSFDPNLGRSFNPESVEDALDKLTRGLQDLSAAIGQSVRLSIGDRGGGVSLILPSAQAHTYLGWNAAGTGLENKFGANFALEIGTVSTGAAGSSATATITPVDSTLANLNLTIPRGDRGINGDGSGDLIAANNLSDVDDVSIARANLGLVIGTDVQAYHARLAAFAALSGADNKLPYLTGTNTVGLTDLSAFGRNLIDDVDAAAARTTLGAAATSHNHNASDINAGTVATARLGSGSATNATFLRGDQTWQVPPTGGWAEIAADTVAGAVASVEFSGAWDYGVLRLIIMGASGSASNNSLCVQISDDDGSTWETVTGSLNPMRSNTTDTHSVLPAVAISTSTITLSSPWAAAASNNHCAVIDITVANKASSPKLIAAQSQFSAGGDQYAGIVTGVSASCNAINRVRWFWSSGNVDAGTSILLGA